MLKQRVLTAFILIPLVFCLLFFAPRWLFNSVTAMVILLGAWEWSHFMGVRLYPLGIGMLMGIGWYFPLFSIFLGSLFWIGVILMLGYLIYRHRPYRPPDWFVGLSGVFALVPCWVGFDLIREMQDGKFLLCVLLLGVWAVDTGAYFAGCRWGNHKLAPLISPKKTWEGCLGGALAVLFVTGMYGNMLLGVVILIGSIMGDLFESLLKRTAHMKDSGTLLPGHGGILDRMDSLLAVVPLFAWRLLT